MAEKTQIYNENKCTAIGCLGHGSSSLLAGISLLVCYRYVGKEERRAMLEHTENTLRKGAKDANREERRKISRA